MRIWLVCLLIFNIACSSKFISKKIERNPYATGLVFVGQNQKEIDLFLDTHELAPGQILLYQTFKSSEEVKIYVYQLKHIQYIKTKNEYLFLPRHEPLQDIVDLAPQNKPQGFYFPQPKNFKERREYKGEAITSSDEVRFYYNFIY